MHLEQQYTDPRLVELYDGGNGRGADTSFYLQLAADLNARLILDLGCGTGLLTRELATDGRTIIGIDPAPTMLAYAQRQPGAERVQWVEGDSSTLGATLGPALGAASADLVIMTGNVAQIFLEDSDWNRTLADIHAALRPGGRLAFESRNPAGRAWEHWNRQATFQTTHTPHGPVEEWLELVSVANGRVRFEGHNHFLATGERIIVPSELRFRTQQELIESLNNTGFTVEHIYGDWHRNPVTNTSRVFVFVARQI